jgi:hypothetical protein
MAKLPCMSDGCYNRVETNIITTTGYYPIEPIDYAPRWGKTVTFREHTMCSECMKWCEEWSSRTIIQKYEKVINGITYTYERRIQ